MPERNIPGVNMGVHPMADVTPNHIYDANDPFGQWTMVKVASRSPHNFHNVFESKVPRFAEPQDRTPRIAARDAAGAGRGRELSSTTYGSAWYKMVGPEEPPTPYLGPAATGGSQLLAVRREAADRVQRILGSCEATAAEANRVERMKGREESWQKAKQLREEEEQLLREEQQHYHQRGQEGSVSARF